MGNYLKEQGAAHQLAHQIREYWFARGYPLADAWVEEFGREIDGTPCYAIRSNLVNGTPPRGAVLMAAA